MKSEGEKLKIEYSIISRGTEKHGTKGYMGITEINEEKRFFVLSKHNEQFVNSYKDAFIMEKKYEIENISISRFELMIELALEDKKSLIRGKIMIAGLGNVGFSSLLYLLDNGYKEIYVYIKGIKDFQVNAIQKLNVEYNANVKIVDEIGEYATYIEATGSSEVIENIMGNINNNSILILLGTPREEKVFFSPLQIHRNNIIIIGAHELNGHPWEKRNKMFMKLLEQNHMRNLNQYVTIYNFDKNIVKKVLDSKRNFVEVLKYDI